MKTSDKIEKIRITLKILDNIERKHRFQNVVFVYHVVVFLDANSIVMMPWLGLEQKSEEQYVILHYICITNVFFLSMLNVFKETIL